MEDLFTSGPYAGKPWLDQISPECRARVDELVDLCIKYHPRQPNWKAAFLRLRDEFPVDAPAGETTVKDAVRRLVKERQGG